MKKLLLISGCLLTMHAHSQTVDNHIKIDQFGYLPTAQKIAVISNPVTGFNAGDAFAPSTTYKIRRASDNITIFQADITSWSAGATHDQSGDKAWWFDFSAVTTPGTYYVFDSILDKKSYTFDIREDVYNEVLKQAVRSFFYQRCGVAKSTPHAHSNWDDAACHIGAQQDLDCRLVSNTNVSTSKNLSGGWHDAGDYNKYVNFAFIPLSDLLLAYEENPSVWGDNYDLPESGNGVADLLDEIKYELDWLLKMQNSNGSVLSKVSVTDFNASSPPSNDPGARRYGAESSSSTASACAIYALAAKIYKSSGDANLIVYGNTLETAAVNAWTWLSANPGVVFSNAGFQSANPEVSTDDLEARSVCAAVYLFALTGNTTYQTYIDANYNKVHLIEWTYAYPFENNYQDALLYYAKTTGATTSVKNSIYNIYTNSLKTNNADNLPAFTNKTDAYRAFLATNNYTWGSNHTKADQANMFLNMNHHNLDAANSVNYRNAASGFIHYMHGVNPLAFVYLSNMNSFGAENSINEFYHSWFFDGTQYDRAGVSTYGPAPGYVPGGANPTFAPDASYTGPALVPPMSQPAQKSYKDWNTSYPQNSWEVTENSIVYQGAYVRMLSKFAGTVDNPTPTFDQKSSALIKIFPNPAKEQFNIFLPENKGKISWEILDNSGKKLMQHAEMSNSWVIDVSTLSSGIYFLKVKNGENISVEKIVKQ